MISRCRDEFMRKIGRFPSAATLRGHAISGCAGRAVVCTPGSRKSGEEKKIERLVPEVGIEPTLPEGNGILRPTTGKKTGAKTQFRWRFRALRFGAVGWDLVAFGRVWAQSGHSD